MKKYRCPCCGEECITTAYKMFPPYTGEGGRDRSERKLGTECPKCTERYLSRGRYGDHFANGIFVFYFVSAFFLAGLSLITGGFWILLTFPMLFPISVAFSIYKRSYFALVKCDRYKNEPMYLDHNAVVEISNATQRIENLDILGIRFSEKTCNVRFAEVFTGGLVPVVFYKDQKKQISRYRVTFMKSEHIPKELLQVDAEFTVVDNGVDIATGTIIKLVENTNKT